MITNNDHEGQIFISHPHTNNGFHHYIPHLILENHEKDFQKILNSLRCVMVTSFEHFNDFTDRYATVHFLPLQGLVWVCEIEYLPRVKT